MKGKRLSMREIRKILEYRLEKHISADRTALALQYSKGSVINTIKRFRASGLSWPLPADLSDTELEKRLYPGTGKVRRRQIFFPDIAYIQEELNRPHMTLQRLWEEYHWSHPDDLSRSSYYRYVHRHTPVSVYMRQHHMYREVGTVEIYQFSKRLPISSPFITSPSRIKFDTD